MKMKKGQICLPYTKKHLPVMFLEWYKCPEPCQEYILRYIFLGESLPVCDIQGNLHKISDSFSRLYKLE